MRKYTFLSILTLIAFAQVQTPFGNVEPTDSIKSALDINMKSWTMPSVVMNEYDIHGYSSFREGSRFKENSLLMEENFRISLGFYIESEVANPLGTSKKKHKICAVYWVLANIAAKLCSSLNLIQLALLCKVNTIKECGTLKSFIHSFKI